MFHFKEENLTGFEARKSIVKEGYSINEIIYESPYKGIVSAYLYVPNHNHELPAVIFIHPGQANRKNFFKEAEMLTKKGFVSLVIETQLMNVNHQDVEQENKRFIETIEPLVDIQNYIKMIMDIRRGITLLSKQGFVDANRIAYVGHGVSATWGGVLAGIETRIKTFIFISGASKLSEWHMKSEHPLALSIRSFITPERFEHFISNLRKLDAIHYVKNAAPASIYFQFANDDEYVDHSLSMGFYSASSLPKKMNWYQTDHEFTDCDDALLDRHDWIFEQIGVSRDSLITESTKN
ncbi:cephalosporin-C deacetylase-like acetyl esterase [Bacillus sp. SORGH_AS 510]|uniref:alpha/beta hydrolase n=1 Tax=Bacillus sp. SORGH_AS_0510 TaxID=3041771 RepID=UPI00277D65D0|nr:hypothetical protein [Bacillus sp. SORGH_AS_0510]MDQ1145554.1 cephalosporin-C deacetylase-like acetyl esterase [Bacillus sp. SORGH_AS_0510]